jgi:hypothetical protein
VAADKLNSSLKQLLSYVKSCPILVKPKSSGLKNYLIKKLEDLGGTIKGSYFGNNLVGQIPLKSLKELAKDERIEQIMFRGNVELIKQSPVLDNNLIELLSMLDLTGIIFETHGDLTEEIEKKIIELGGMRPDPPYYLEGKYDNFYSAKLPLEKIEIFAECSSIKRIWYDQPIHGMDVLDTITNYSGGE